MQGQLGRVPAGSCASRLLSRNALAPTGANGPGRPSLAIALSSLSLRHRRSLSRRGPNLALRPAPPECIAARLSGLGGVVRPV